MYVQACLGGGDGQDEAADEKHHHGVCETGHDLLVAEQLTGRGGVANPFDARIGGEQQEQYDDGDRRGPGRDQLQHPHQGGVHEDGDDALLHRRKAVDSEGFRGKEPEEEDGGGDENKAEGFLF